MIFACHINSVYNQTHYFHFSPESFDFSKSEHNKGKEIKVETWLKFLNIFIIITDLLFVTETALSQNQDRALITEDHEKKTSMLTKHLHHVEEEKAKQVCTVQESTGEIQGL